MDEQWLLWFSKWVMAGSFVMAFLIASIRSIKLFNIRILYELQLIFVLLFWIFLSYCLTGWLLVFVISIWAFALILHKRDKNW